MLSHNGQIAQDLFVIHCLQQKKNGYFLEIGSSDPITINNTYPLEKNFNWKGIMIEYNTSFSSEYKNKRPNSVHVLQDATTINYKELFEKNNVPYNIDYLQIDLEVTNSSTIKTLKLLEPLMDTYKFATVTFEHDIYRGDYFDTRSESRRIFLEKGYKLIFPDVRDGDSKFEDWYVHPDLVDVNRIAHLITEKSLDWREISKFYM